MSWKMLTAATVCLLAASLGTAADMYDEIPPGDMNYVYQEHNYIDQDPEVLPDLNADAVKSFLLYKMLSSFRNQDVSPSVLAGPKWIPSDTLMHPEELDLQLKDGMMKRISNVNGLKTKVRRPSKPAQKWKIKKGKVGSQMICYFKLCAFRPPNP